ncbi:NAD(+) synthase [Alkaliphilus oremlandii]|uniref:NH(3)-dependent NAD(+) synthetase n=1 Tax=Alkaliphilus oremlandii (strain OhILAs) TaxID=350688 RepID=NADE_ALKOO|nr:NAD(+) synthase [Alkaliphilus oremlandii]A8MHN7.1 RecName: Full=NH(3)-dependent NAD(+) synthetase [Alkaliphilus oremlandii OhILAs]ABW19319.1 NAD+ synthetase [Alkaliphilus oremlandii OhILAs]
MTQNIQKNIDQVVEWLREQVRNAGAKGLTVGISGGIDSAVVACLIKKAFPENSLGVILPIKSSTKDVEHGILTAEACGIEYIEIDLGEEHNTVANKVVHQLNNKNLFNTGMERAMDSNLRARLRMSTLYAVANNLNYLVVGTDNAAEIYTGYFTKYGDGGVDILPIASLKKYEVYEWAKVLGVPKEVLEKEPSAGLWEGQTDEGEMGTSYKYIDEFLEGKAIPEKDLTVIERLHRNSAHKRTMPPSPKIG